MLNFLEGSATNGIPNECEYVIIAHICNDIGRWGAGFVLAVSAKWNEPECEYLAQNIYNLGEVQFVQVEENIAVANMIAQRNVRDYTNTEIPPIRYDALETCLKSVNLHAQLNMAEIHMPRIGAGLAGGDWNRILKIITKTLTVPTYIYTLK